jgi:hypothetical protein
MMQVPMSHPSITQAHAVMLQAWEVVIRSQLIHPMGQDWYRSVSESLIHMRDYRQRMLSILL